MYGGSTRRSAQRFILKTLRTEALRTKALHNTLHNTLYTKALHIKALRMGALYDALHDALYRRLCV